MVRTLCFQLTCPNPVHMYIMAVRHVHHTCRGRALSPFVSARTCRIMELHTHRRAGYNRRKARSQRMAPVNIAMIVLTVLMYCMSTVHIALALRVNLIAFFDQHAIEGGVTILDNQGDPLVWIQIMLELVNVSRPHCCRGVPRLRCCLLALSPVPDGGRYSVLEDVGALGQRLASPHFPSCLHLGRARYVQHCVTV